MADLILFALLLAWLFVCMVYDLRFREVPAWLTIFPLVIVGLFALWRGWWVPPLLAAALILISDLEPRERRYAFAGLVSAFAAIFEPATALTVAILATIWVLWEIRAMGGADAKLLMVVTLVLPQPAVFLWIALAGGLQGLVAFGLRKKEVPYIVAIFAGTLLFSLQSVLYPIS
jgi:Flp pilus assembly protein protease CpaA